MHFTELLIPKLRYFCKIGSALAQLLDKHAQCLTMMKLIVRDKFNKLNFMTNVSIFQTVDIKMVIH